MGQNARRVRDDLGWNSVHKSVGWLLVASHIPSLTIGCGGDQRRLGDGSWYGKVVAVNVSKRTLTFAPACRFSKSRRWTATSRVPAAVTLSRRADVEIYYRPNGSPAQGHGQSAELSTFADVALHGRSPASPPGWFVTVREGAAMSVEQDSGVTSSGKADRQTFACVWSRSTRRFLGR
jgi:hypothetical protein